MQIHLTIRNDIELLGKFSVSPSPCADKGNGGTGGPWTWAWAETGWKRVGNARREAQTISSYSGLVWTPEGAGAAPLRVNLSESVAQHLKQHEITPKIVCLAYVTSSEHPKAQVTHSLTVVLGWGIRLRIVFPQIATLGQTLALSKR
ncbi:Homoserine dehydrogenase [Fusarium oxysporum f. sp. albedinis]|nr:Homoserine dehydrogenase [Fusarium oxysporum f. sp. albedinis]